MKRLLAGSGCRSLVGILTLGLLLTGCTTTKPTYSGWLGNYSQLQPDPEYEGAMIYTVSDEMIKKYKKFIIEPVSFYVSPDIKINEGDEAIDAETVHQVTVYFRDALIKALAENYEVVDKPGRDVARIRAAITGVQLTKKEMKARNYIPVALVATAIGEATGIRDKLSVINMEGEVLDSLTGRRIGAVVQRQAHEVSAQKAEDLEGKDVYPTLDYWAQKAKKKFDRIHSQ